MIISGAYLALRDYSKNVRRDRINDNIIHFGGTEHRKYFLIFKIGPGPIREFILHSGTIITFTIK